jgi:CPA2 family monovalent cation:H+ antiporter-2
MIECASLLAAAEQGVWNSLLEILVLLGAAMVLGVVAERLRQSAVVGYLVAGALVGPGALGWVADEQRIFQIAELGVALLLFTIGLEFSPQRLMQLGRVALLSGPLQVVLTTLAGMAAASWLGFSPRESFVIGAMIALSSTACVLRVLKDRAELDSQYGRASLGILLVQDVAVVPLVLVVTALSGGGTLARMALDISASILLAVMLVAVFYVLFNRVMPLILVMQTWRRNRDLPILLTVCMAGGAAWVAHALHLSPALGAFLAGVLLAISPFAMQIQADIQPLRAVLVTLFFASIGMFSDLSWFVDNFFLVASVVAVIVLGKLTIVALLAWAAGLPLTFAVTAGFCLAQIGEFSFVLAMIAREDLTGGSPLSPTVFQVMVSATIVSLLITPYLVAAGPFVGGWLGRGWGGRRGTTLHRPASEDELQTAGDTVSPAIPVDDAIMIIGFGPAGQRVAEELMGELRDRIVVLDLNIDNVKFAWRYGLSAMVGDATQTDVLEHGGVGRAQVVVITVPTVAATRRLIHHVRHIAPGALIVCRSRYHIHRWELLRAGADAVIDEEDHVGHRMAQEVQAIVAPKEKQVDATDS